MYRYIIITIITIIPLLTQGAKLSGFVFEKDRWGNDQPLPNVHIYWADSQTGTFTNDQGKFTINKIKNSNVLVVSFVGYEKDSIRIGVEDHHVSIELSRNLTLQKMVITARASSTYMAKGDPIATQHITGSELHKAACCNLGESFETNASVDISYGDAISGAKKIELLGLAGNYTQLLIENIPDYYGFGRTFGLNYIPGHWLESISVSKGASSVVTGNESITGQISADYKKPDGKELFYLNLYGNHNGHGEINSNWSYRINKQMSTMLLLHGGYNDKRIDHNDDNFMDEPLTRNLHAMNRWKYLSKDGRLMAQAGVSFLTEERVGGAMMYRRDGMEGIPGIYGFNIQTDRFSSFYKGGYMFKQREATNLAILGNVSTHEQDAVFGLSHHKVKQTSVNQRAVFDTYLGNTNHILQLGGAIQYIQYNEQINDSVMDRIENTPGIFTQYTYTHLQKFTFMAGMRTDFNNLYGFQWTPRIHLRYQPFEHTTLRLSAGKGYRTVNIYAENLFLLASSRQMVLEDALTPEIAWNYGLHISQELTIAGREAHLNAELFRTDFTSQMIIDMDREVERIYLYQLKGKSFANNFQVDFTFEPLKKLDVLLAFRMSDARSTVNGELKSVAFSKRHKGLVNLSYKTRLNKWQFDFTTQFNGPSRLPYHPLIEEDNPLATTSPAYTIFNAQVTKYFRKWNIYVGSENLSNFAQHHAIIATDDPFGPYFDASRVWGPVMGRKIYMGLRYTISR